MALFPAFEGDGFAEGLRVGFLIAANFLDAGIIG
jgi:hypothetical protein